MCSRSPTGARPVGSYTAGASNGMVRRTVLCVPLLAACVLSAQAPPPAAAANDFPEFDGSLWTLRENRRTAARVSRALAEDPASAATFTLLNGQAHAEDAVRVLEAIVARRPEEIRKAMAVLAERIYYLADDASGRRARLRAIVQAVKAKLPSLPREEAASIDYALIRIDADLERTGSRDWIPRLQRIQQLYPGTAAARSARMELSVPRASMRARVDALEAFARSHPGTPEGAEALYQAGFNLAVNLPEDKRGEEPSARFAKVVAIARELESGAWAASEWVTRAPSLVTQFSTYEPRHSPEGIRTMLEVYAEFIGSHFGSRDDVAYVINTKMPALLRAAGESPLVGMERFFDRWARVTGQRDAVRFARAVMLQSLGNDSQAPEREAARAKAVAAFEEIAATGSGVYQRKALATVASIHFRERNFAEAAKIYERHLEAFPQSDWAWAAKLRLGQSLEEIGDWTAASRAYQRAAEDPADGPARLFGSLHAARAEQALGNYAEALRFYRAAQQAWDSAYATGYLSSAALTSYVQGGSLKSASPVTTGSLAAAIARLETAVATEGGALLEQARGLIEYERWGDARASLDRFLRQHPRSPLAPEARYRAHIVQLQQALNLADVQSASPQAAAALAALDAIAADPWDPAVGIARIARACILLSMGDAQGAEAAMRAALTEWREKQTPPPGGRRLTGIEEDVAEIRRLAFRPAGGDPYTRERRWEAFPKAVLPPFATVKPDVPVVLPGGRITSVRAFRASADVPPVLFIDDEQIALLHRVVEKLGGNRTRQPSQPMEVPHQPIGGSMAIVGLWNRFFNAVPGHWGGWMFESPPTVTRIEFLNAERTKASAFVTIRYEGATLVMEKEGGVWKVTAIVSRWIT